MNPDALLDSGSYQMQHIGELTTIRAILLEILEPEVTVLSALKTRLMPQATYTPIAGTNSGIDEKYWTLAPRISSLSLSVPFPLNCGFCGSF